jgi:hypothetical protein
MPEHTGPGMQPGRAWGAQRCSQAGHGAHSQAGWRLGGVCTTSEARTRTPWWGCRDWGGRVLPAVDILKKVGACSLVDHKDAKVRQLAREIIVSPCVVGAWAPGGASVGTPRSRQGAASRLGLLDRSRPCSSPRFSAAALRRRGRRRCARHNPSRSVPQADLARWVGPQLAKANVCGDKTAEKTKADVDNILKVTHPPAPSTAAGGRGLQLLDVPPGAKSGRVARRGPRGGVSQGRNPRPAQ